MDFLKDLGFTSSNDRSIIKVLKYLGLLDAANKPTSFYREFMDGSRSKSVLGSRLRVSYDDLFLADKEANNQTVAKLKGWFKTKTGVGDSVAEKLATTFKALATYAIFDNSVPTNQVEVPLQEEVDVDLNTKKSFHPCPGSASAFNFAYRIEVHLPDTSNIDTYRAIFRAIREELA